MVASNLFLLTDILKKCGFVEKLFFMQFFKWVGRIYAHSFFFQIPGWGGWFNVKENKN